MGNIYTKTGDGGETGLYGGTRISKCSPRVMAYGTVDEANAFLGVLKNEFSNTTYTDLFEIIQEKLFVVGGELSSDERGLKQLKTTITEKDVTFIESVIDELNRQVPANHQFMKPGTDKVDGLLHFARTIIRRAEREVITSCDVHEVNPWILKYLNRLSDLMFILSKTHAYQSANHPSANKQSEWQLTLALAEEMTNRCKRASRKIDVPVVIALVDPAGHLVHFTRMEGALLGSIDIAINKAYTSAALKLPTSTVGELAQPGAALYGIENTNQGRIVIFGGGYPLIKNGQIIGAIGVSGGSVEEDQTIAKAGMSVLED